MRKQKQKGFTIIELVVVIVILGILAAVAFPKFENMSQQARDAVLDGAKAAVLSAAVIQFAKNTGVKQTAAAIASGVTLDSAITVTTAACTGFTLTHSGGGTKTFNISDDYCS